MLKRLIFAGCAVMVNTGAAMAGWAYETGSYEGKNWVESALEYGGYTMTMSCREDSANGDATSLLIGKDFPNIYSADDANIVFTWRFNFQGGVTSDHTVPAHFFAPDSAWINKLEIMDPIMLKAFANARSLTFLSPESKEVVTLEMAGSGKVAAAMSAQCGLPM